MGGRGGHKKKSNQHGKKNRNQPQPRTPPRVRDGVNSRSPSPRTRTGAGTEERLNTIRPRGRSHGNASLMPPPSGSPRGLGNERNESAIPRPPRRPRGPFNEPNETLTSGGGESLLIPPLPSRPRALFSGDYEVGQSSISPPTNGPRGVTDGDEAGLITPPDSQREPYGGIPREQRLGFYNRLLTKQRAEARAMRRAIIRRHMNDPNFGESERQRMMSEIRTDLHLPHFNLVLSKYEPQPQPQPHQSESEENEECMICMQEFEVDEKIQTLPCKHYYHSYCIRRWFERNWNCPLCRDNVAKGGCSRNKKL